MNISDPKRGIMVYDL